MLYPVDARHIQYPCLYESISTVLSKKKHQNNIDSLLLHFQERISIYSGTCVRIHAAQHIYKNWIFQIFKQKL